MKTKTCLALTLCAAGLPAAQAYTVGITPGQRALFLQVGTGTMSGGYFSAGGTPGNNSTVNTASVTVPSAQLGSGTAQAMTTNSTVTSSPFEGYGFCNSPATTGQIYVGGFYRVPGSTGAAATLSVTTPANLVNANGDTVAFSTIAWTSSGNGDSSPTIPSGSFTGGSQGLLSVTRNTWFESCLAFRYLNTQIVPAGTFTGRATFTLTAP
ncbi:hypothetical protein [Variovorax sp. KK3]|uniref:hypothetical protein n=1 Tax=Variovorax sp. KK3 TaxID=1855728 RepID=UPI00097C5D4B|nr:hypothetical protein [Variovorax sp. KK3]